MRFLKRVAQSVTLLILKHSSLSLSHYCAFKDLKPQLLMISKDWLAICTLLQYIFYMYIAHFLYRTIRLSSSQHRVTNDYYFLYFQVMHINPEIVLSPPCLSAQMPH